MSLSDDMKKFLASEIVKWAHRENVTQKVAAEALGLTQPRLSNLMNGHLDKFSIEALMDCLQSSGYVFRMRSEEDKLTIQMINI